MKGIPRRGRGQGNGLTLHLEDEECALAVNDMFSFRHRKKREFRYLSRLYKCDSWKSPSNV